MFFRVFKVADEKFETQIGKKQNGWPKMMAPIKKYGFFFLRFFLVLLEINFCESESSILKNKKIHCKVWEFFSIA